MPPRPGNVRTPANSVRIGEECARVAELRAQGASFRSIAGVMSIPVSTVHDRWTEALTFRTQPAVDAAIEASLRRLDFLDERLVAPLHSTDLKLRIRAVEAARRNDESRRVLLGTNQPQRVEVTDSSEPSEIDAAIIELSRRHAAKYANDAT